MTHLDCKVVLIDGVRLSRLVLDPDLGVSTVANHAVKRIDSDFFGEEDSRRIVQAAVTARVPFQPDLTAGAGGVVG